MKNVRIIGGVLLGIGILWIIIYSLIPNSDNSPVVQKDKKTQKESTVTGSRLNCPPETLGKFPISGEGLATATATIKARLNPRKSHIQAWGGHTKFVLESDPSIFFICACKKPNGESGDPAKWSMMPDGDYLIYAYMSDEVQVSWYQ